MGAWIAAQTIIPLPHPYDQRAFGQAHSEPTAAAHASLSFGDISLNSGASILSCGELSVRLSEKEFRILEYLIANQGQLLTREQLAVKIWGYDNDAEYNNVEVYMSFVRKKLHFVQSQTEIKAVRGLGYELRYGHV